MSLFARRFPCSPVRSWWTALGWWCVLSLVCVSALCATAYGASAETPEDQARRAAEIYKTTMSPFCPGRTVDACPSPNATAWRDDIRLWVSEGLSTEEIRRRLKKRADQDLSGAPTTAADSVLPVVATVLSLVLLGFLLRLLVKPGANSLPTSAGETLPTKERGKTAAQDKASEDELDDRLKRELEQMDD